MNDADVQIRPYRAGDEPRILDTFNLVFREACGPGFVDRTLAQWQWLYLRNPAGHRIVLATAADGTVVSQYAGVPQLADTPWGPQRFVHCVDSMTHPQWRLGFQPPLFVRTGNRYREQCVQLGEAMCYGLPIEGAFRIGQAVFRYEQMRTIEFLVRARTLPPPQAPAGVAVARIPALPPDTDALWAAVHRPEQCRVRRDARYLQWRYFDHPDPGTYETLAAHTGTKLTGLLVLRRDQALLPGATAIADWLVADDDPTTAAALLAAAARSAQSQDRSLFTVFAPWSAEHRLLLAHGFTRTRTADLERRLVHHIHHPSLTPDYLARSWWYTLGDTDLV